MNYWLVLWVFAITASNLWKFVAISFSMHWVRKVFAMRCLIHGWPWTTLNASSLTWIFVWATVIYSVVLLCIIWVMGGWASTTIYNNYLIMMINTTVILNWVGSIHTIHNVGEIAWSINCLADVWAIMHCRICYWLTCRILNWSMVLILLRLTWLRGTRLNTVLREVHSTWLALASAWSLVWSTHVVFFPTLWAYSSKST